MDWLRVGAAKVVLSSWRNYWGGIVYAFLLKNNSNFKKFEAVRRVPLACQNPVP